MKKRPTLTTTSPSQSTLATVMVAATCLVLALLVVGCSSTPKNSRISRITSVAVAVTTEDVLYRSDVVNEGGVKGIANRLAKETIRAMEERGIRGDVGAKADQPKLHVELTTIETVTKHRPGPFFSTIVRQDVKIMFYAKLISADGTILFSVRNGRKADESIDGVIQTIANWLAKQVNKHCE